MQTPADDVQQFAAELGSLAAELPDPLAGFFGPGSVQWTVSRERVLLLGGMRALLLQIAHPKVAQGVADHSNFRADPLGRGMRTFHIVYSMVFGTAETAIRSASRMRRIHGRVRGVLADPLPGLADASYDACDPSLMAWVYATLVDSTMVSYELFLPPLPEAAWEQFYQESKIFARLCGIDSGQLPARLADFRRWMAGTIASDTIAVTPTARAVAHALFYGSPLAKALSPLNYVLAAGTLPAKLRVAYGLKWGWPVRLAFRGVVRAVRLSVPLLPETVRAESYARQAEQRCGGLASGDAGSACNAVGGSSSVTRR